MCVLCGPDGAAAVVDHSITHPFDLEPETDYRCSECGGHVSAHPDKLEFLAKHQMDTIIRKGHQIMSIFGDEPEANFSYTVGRTVKDRPELLCTADMHPDQRGSLLNALAEWDDENPLVPGRLEGPFLCPILIVKIDPDEGKMFAATSSFGDDVVAYQVVFPDEEDRFPHEPGYDFVSQPVYGELP